MRKISYNSKVYKTVFWISEFWISKNHKVQKCLVSILRAFFFRLFHLRGTKLIEPNVEHFHFACGWLGIRLSDSGKKARFRNLSSCFFYIILVTDKCTQEAMASCKRRNRNNILFMFVHHINLTQNLIKHSRPQNKACYHRYRYFIMTKDHCIKKYVTILNISFF